MDKVYLVISWTNTYSSFGIAAIYDNLESAEKHKEKRERDNDMSIEVMSVHKEYE